MKMVSLKQSHRLVSIFLDNVDWSRITSDQAQPLIMDPTGTGDWFTRLLQTGIVKDSQSPVFTRDMTKEGWTLLENVETPPISIANLKLVEFLKDGESCASGAEMTKRAVELEANLGQWQAEYMLEHQDEIPEEFRVHVLVFPGTNWRVCDGGCRVPCLDWDGGRWYLRFSWLVNDFYSSCRLLRSRESYSVEAPQDK